MSGILVRLFAAALLLLPLLAQAQVAFRAAASGTALVPTFRAATVSGIAYRGSATTPAGATSLAPVYRAAASASAATGVLTLTINRPAGTLENDVMVAAIGVSANAPVITAPAGWTLVRRMTNAAANANSLAVYIKVATAAEPANYAWTFSASGGAAGGIQTFYNVDIITPVDAENGQTTPSATSHATPGIVTTVPNTMLVTAYTFSSSRSWNNPPLAPAAPAVTERIDIRSNGNNATGQSTAAHQGIVAAAGAVPALTATASANADVGNTHVLALRPALRVPRLAATAAGDFMVAAIGVQPSTATVTAPAGWTLVSRINNAGPTSNSLVIYRKFALAGEPASYLWQLSGATAAVAGIQTFAGVDTTTPIDAQGGSATASSLTHTAPSIVTTVENAMLVAHFTFASAATWTPPPASGGDVVMGESYDVASQAAGAAGQSLEGARVAHAAIGATATKTATASANADAGAAHILALRPSASTLDIALPAGTAVNDVLIASIGVAWSGAVAPVITPPAGWALVRQVDNNNPTRNSLAVFRKTAIAGEPVIYQFTVTNAAYAVGGIQCFYNVDTAAPIDAENGQNTPSGRDHATPAIATTVPNTMLVGSYTYASSQAWAPRDPDAGGPLVAMTESFDKPSGPAGNTGQSIEGTRLLQAAAGAVPAYTSRAAGGAPTYDRGNTHILALRSANPTLVINIPAGTVADDVMIASIGVAWSGTTAPVATPPAGWTLVRQIDNNTATRNSLFVYRRVAGGSEPASYTWNFTNFIFAVGGIQSFSGVDTTAPVDVENGVATASALTHATPSVATTVTNAMLVTSHTYASSGTWTPPAGMAEGFDVSAWTAPNALGQSTEGSYVLQAAAGATGAKTATASASADRGNAHILALRPAPVIPTPGSFNAFEQPAGFTCASMPVTTNSGPIWTKIAGTGYSLCVVALDSAGPPQILSGFNANVRVEVLARDTVGALDANGCPRTNVGDPPVTTLSDNAPVALSSGRATFAFPAAASAWRDVRIRISYPTVTPTVTRCSGDNHAIRPLALTVTSTTANADNTGVSVINVPAIKAGGNFSLAATALSSYNGTPAIDATKIAAHTGAVQTGSLGGSFDAASAGTGVATGTTFTYSEVGYFNFDINGVYDDGFTAVDQPGDCTNDFSNTLVGGKYGCKFGNTSATSYFGRFIPDRFGLATFASDSLIDRADINTGSDETTCPSSFTYMGEDFKTRFELSARNAANAITQNYTGGHAKFGLATWANFAFTGSSGTLEQGSAAPGGAWGSTAGTYGIAVVTATHRAQRPASPAAPYAAFTVSAQPTYTDGSETVSLPAVTQVHAGNTEMRFGRLRLQNALGSELRPLPVPVWAEHWSGTAFARNTQDSCTVIGAVTLSGAAPCTLAPAVTGAGSTLSSGAGTLSLAAPGVRGCTDLTVTAPDWLKGRWSGATYTQNPSARATFGVFRDRVLYRRENY